MKKWIWFVCVAALAGCGQTLIGTYVLNAGGGVGTAGLTFKSGGKVVQAEMGGALEMPYEVADGQVTLITPQGKVLMQILPDGSIQGPMGLKYIKQQ